MERRLIICLSDNTVGLPEANFVDNAANPPSRYLFCQSNTDDRLTPRNSATAQETCRSPSAQPHETARVTMVGDLLLSIITRQAIRRGTYASVRELTETITAFIDGWNEHCQPFVWTKDADTIIAKAHRKSASSTRH